MNNKKESKKQNNFNFFSQKKEGQIKIVDDKHTKKHTKMATYLEKKFGNNDRDIEKRWGNKPATFSLEMIKIQQECLNSLTKLYLELEKESKYFDMGFDVGYDKGIKTSIIELYPNDEYGDDKIEVHMRPKAEKFIKNKNIVDYNAERIKKEKVLQEKNINFSLDKKSKEKEASNTNENKENIEGYKSTLKF